MLVSIASSTTTGSPLSASALSELRSLTSEAIQLDADRGLFLRFIESRMLRMAPNCSALVGNIYRSVYRRTLSRSAQDIARNDCRRIGKGSLKPGDLLFFPGHVAMYLGDGRYIHSTAKNGSDGVVINSLDPEDPDYRADLDQGMTAVGSIF